MMYLPADRPSIMATGCSQYYTNTEIRHFHRIQSQSCICPIFRPFHILHVPISHPQIPASAVKGVHSEKPDSYLSFFGNSRTHFCYV